MVCKLSRRLFLERSALVGSGASLYSLTLIGCGGGSPTSDKSPSRTPVPAPIPAPAPTPAPTPAPRAAGATQWRPVALGSGGFVTGIDIAKDGTKIVRTDTSGAYIWDDAASKWRGMQTRSSMPKTEWGHETITDGDIYEACIAPNNSNYIYIVFNGFVFKSIDRGVKFTKTSLPKIKASGTDSHRMTGKRMAIDPNNPNVVIVGCQERGAFLTSDGGANWTKIASIPGPKTPSGTLIAFDPASGTANDRTRSVYVASGGNGVYKSSDGGATFTLMQGSPTDHHRMVVDQTGTVWVSSGKPSRVGLLKTGSSSWTTIAPAGTGVVNSIAINPADARHVVAAQDSGFISQSFDGGASWTDVYYPLYPNGAGRRVATDIPWLAWTNEQYMTNGDMMFDPTAPNKLYFVEGIGVWWTNPPKTYTAFDWNSQSKGIEQLVVSKIISPPGGSPLVFSWDRAVFKVDNPDIYPSTHGPNRKHALLAGWSGDYAVNEPNFIVGLMNWWGYDESGYSMDGGATWTKFASVPADVSAGKIGGCIAVSTKDNIVWVPNNNANAYVTKDRGASWQRIILPGTPTSGETGFGWAYYTNRQIVTADKATPGTFYLYNYLNSGGVFRSTDGGTNWTRIFSGPLGSATGVNCSMTAVPGKAGHLFFTGSWQSGENPFQAPFRRSTDGGETWKDVPKVNEVYSFGFGKAAEGSDYPAIYIAGYVDRVWGIWRSDDNAANWNRIGDYPNDRSDLMSTLTGDMNVYGRVYIGFHGAGSVVADIA
jgi:photosystem II stability/assembly factor-like uncharacterized protein